MSFDVDLSPLWTPAQERQLATLRERYGVTRDLLTDREVRRLHFIRWLRSREQAPRD